MLPFLVVWVVNPGLNTWQVITLASSNSPDIQRFLDASSPLIFIAGGTFLILLFPLVISGGEKLWTYKESGSSIHKAPGFMLWHRSF